MRPLDDSNGIAGVARWGAKIKLFPTAATAKADDVGDGGLGPGDDFRHQGLNRRKTGLALTAVRDPTRKFDGSDISVGRNLCPTTVTIYGERRSE